VEWLTLEVFDEAHAAWLWRDRHADAIVSAAIACGADYWEWHEFRFGVAFEVLFRDEAAVEAFRTLPVVRATLELAPDPVHGVLVYRGRGGGAGVAVPRRPRPHVGAGALARPEPASYDEQLGPEPRLLLQAVR
jgi:hypothetical protein